MRFLLDTHVFLWLEDRPERLGDTLTLLKDRRNDVLLSAVSAWEIAIKASVGKLALAAPPREYVTSRIANSDIASLPVEQSHALAVADLPRLHGDPFDRLLIAQARMLGLTLVTADPQVVRYDVDTILV